MDVVIMDIAPTKASQDGTGTPVIIHERISPIRLVSLEVRLLTIFADSVRFVIHTIWHFIKG